MRNECNIIKDLLPLYIEGMVSEDTASFVEEHTQGCAVCRAELEMMKRPIDLEKNISVEANSDAEELQNFKKEWTKKNRIQIGKAATITSVFLVLLLIGLQRYMMKFDLELVRMFRQPKFCIAIDSYKDDGKGTYLGLGYSFDIETFFPEKEIPVEVPVPDFTSYSTKILGLEIDERWVDYDFDSFEGTVFKVEQSQNSDFYYVYLEDIGQKISLVDARTKFLNMNSQDTCEIRVGDSVKIDTAFFQFVQQGTTKDDWLYYASQVTFLE